MALILTSNMMCEGAERISFAQESIKEKDYYIEYLNKEYGLTKSEQKYIYETAKEYDLEYDLVLSICKVESNFKKDCRSDSNDSGLMQVNDFWIKPLSKEFGYKVDLMDFKTNVKAGCYILAQNFKDWKKYEKISIEKYYYLSVNSYNAGTRNINKSYVSRGRNIKTRDYGQLVMDTFYKFMDGKYDFEPRD